jgi:integrase/recombinase XerD
MLERFYESPRHLRHLRREPLAEHMDLFAGRLYRLGFTQQSGHRILCLTGRFNDFARSACLKSAAEIDDSLITRFIQEELPRHGVFKDAPGIMRHLREHLWDEGVLPRPICARPVDPFDNILHHYDHYLSNIRGLVPTSCSQYLRYARQFLSWLQHQRGNKPLARADGVDVLEFSSEFAQRHRSGSWRNNLCSLTRVFLRYLRWEGTIASDLDRAIPKLPGWRLASIPRHLPWEQVRELMESIDTTRPVGLRDKAVLLLIATLGLRNQEIRYLQVGDIAWRSGEIRLRKTKTRRERVLPLPGTVGAAIANYLLHGRPRLSFPQVFLRHRAPLGPITSTHGIGDIVDRHLSRSGIQSSCRGAHLLRHSLATRMVNQAVPIKEIADVLGHLSIDTTAIYTKVDIANLRAVALPFPGGKP